MVQKRKLYGLNKTFKKPLICPRPIKGTPATVLKVGTYGQAGMKDDAVEQIDAICSEWAKNSDQAFAVCLARRGFVFFHKAYGKRDGKAMTVNTTSHMASATKPLAGILMMMLVDQGLVSLDDPISKYLPSFRVEVPKPITIRHLYTHTAGFGKYDLYYEHDTEELLAAYYPHFKVGHRFQYTTADYTLAGAIMELVTGKELSQFYSKHLFDPLGCKNSTSKNAGTDAWCVPYDFAIIGQMLLNRGAYGKWRFLSEEAFDKMLPKNLYDLGLLNRKTERDWGIGFRWYTMNGVERSAIGHNASSKATFRADLKHDLVIVMTRNRGGKNYRRYHGKFIDAIYKAIEK